MSDAYQWLPDSAANAADKIAEFNAALSRLQVVDFRGNVFTVGDTVLYPRMWANSVEMQEGVVVDIKSFEDSRYLHRDPATGKPVYEPVTKYKVRIAPTRSSRGFYRSATGYSKNYKNIKTTPVWIQLGENVVKA